MKNILLTGLVCLIIFFGCAKENAPEVVSTIPEDNATGIDVYDDIKITYSGKVDIEAADISLQPPLSYPILATMSMVDGGKSINFSFVEYEDLNYGQLYRVTVSDVTDPDGVEVEDYSFSFTTLEGLEKDGENSLHEDADTISSDLMDRELGADLTTLLDVDYYLVILDADQTLTVTLTDVSNDLKISVADMDEWYTEIVTVQNPAYDSVMTLSYTATEAGSYLVIIEAGDVNFNNSLDHHFHVVFSVGGNQPMIEVKPDSLAAACQVGNDPSPAVFTVRNSGSGTLTYAVADDADWLSVTPSDGSSDGETDTVTAAFAADGLAVGTYTGTITVSDAAAGNSPVTIVAVLTVSAAPVPVIAANVTGLSAACDAGSDPDDDSFAVWNSGGGILSYTVTDDADWITVAPATGTSGGEYDTIAVTYDASGLSAGSYTGTITITAPGTDTPRTIDVSLTVNAVTPPAISLGTSALTPTCNQGSDAVQQSFTVTNTGGGTLDYTVTDDAAWLSVSPAAGTGETDVITVTYSTSGLAKGTHTATITVTDADAGNSPQTISVTLTVTDAPVITSGDITYDVIWSGTVTVTGDVVVKGGGSLTIEPGTEVKFARTNDNVQYGSASQIFLVAMQTGILNATGTAGSRITFTSADAAPAKGYWGQIRIMGNGTRSAFAYCDIMYSSQGCEVENTGVTGTSHPAFDNCSFSQIQGTALYVANGHSLTATNCNVHDCNLGFMIDGALTADISYSYFHTLSSGIVLIGVTGYSSTVTMDHLTVFNIKSTYTTDPKWWSGYGIFAANEQKIAILRNSIIAVCSEYGLDSNNWQVSRDYNCWYANTSGNTEVGAVASHDLQADPQFTSYIDADFSLKSTSPCRSVASDGKHIGAWQE